MEILDYTTKITSFNALSRVRLLTQLNVNAERESKSGKDCTRKSGKESIYCFRV